MIENAVACALLKRQHFLVDTRGEVTHLHSLKDKMHREVNFVTIRKKQIEYLIEVKVSDRQPAPALKYFGERLEPKQTIQLVQNLGKELQFGKVQVLDAAKWLELL